MPNTLFNVGDNFWIELHENIARTPGFSEAIRSIQMLFEGNNYNSEIRIEAYKQLLKEFKDGRKTEDVC